MQRLLIALICLFLVTAGCGKAGKIGSIPEGSGTVKLAPEARPELKWKDLEPVLHVTGDPSPILSVGDHSFSGEDVALRAQVIRFKYGSVRDITVKSLAQLISGYLYASVLEAMKQPITFEDLRKEVERIDKSTRAPEDLKKIKKIFEGENVRGGDGERKYAMIFVLPDFANRTFNFEVFPKDKSLQRDRLAAAHAVLKKLTAKKTPDLAAFAKQNGEWRADEVLFSPTTGFKMKPLPGAPTPPTPSPPPSPHGELPEAEKGRWARMEDELLARTKKGQLVNQVVELDTAFLILKPRGWHDEKKRIRLVERLILPKLSSHEYYRKKVSEIPVKITDPSLAKKLRKTISWARDVKWAE